MFFARRPSLQAIERFAAWARELPLSYNPIGIAQDPPEATTRGYDIDARVVLRNSRHSSRSPFGILVSERMPGGLGLGDRVTKFGFAYGTLVSHAESGEEMFEVRLHPESGEVTYRIRAISRPRAVIARLGYPMVRLLQARFRRESAEAMRRATGAAGYAAEK